MAGIGWAVGAGLNGFERFGWQLLIMNGWHGRRHPCGI